MPEINPIIGLAIFLIIAFFALRSVALWYWKVEEILNELKTQNQYLKLLVEKNNPVEQDNIEKL